MMSRNTPVWKYYVAIARPDHWVKHIFVLPGFLAAIALIPQLPTPAAIIVNLIFGFTSACLIASANYVINEWLDAKSDQNHPEKKTRPSALGYLSAKWVYGEYAALAIMGFIFAHMVNTVFFAVSVIFFFSGIVYNVRPLRAKEMAYLDVIVESANNPIRLVLGWAMISGTSIPPLSLIICYWTGGAFLMAAKRLSEYRFIVRLQSVASAASYRKSFSYYSTLSLTLSCFVYALMSSFGLAIFLIKYKSELVFSFPFIVILFTYYLYLALQSDTTVQKPEKLHRDWKLMAIVVAVSISMTLSAFVELPIVSILIESNYIDFRVDEIFK